MVVEQRTNQKDEHMIVFVLFLQCVGKWMIVHFFLCDIYNVLFAYTMLNVM